MTNSVTALVLCLLIALVAVTQSQAPPPAIAEISPQANKAITDAPTEQSSRFGSGGNGAGEGNQANTTTTTVPLAASTATPTTVVPRRHKCVGQPPRQTEDPQSPPCVAYWEGDNGGATSKGVTRDEIRVVVPNYTSGPFDLLEKFFNDRFEFYGRKLRLIDGSSLSMGQPDSDEAAAAQVDEQFHAFASGSGNISDFYYYVDVARRGIIALPIELTYGDAQLSEIKNVYQYVMGGDRVLTGAGQWACSRLVGQPTSHAGPLLNGKPRTFGLVFMKDWGDNHLTADPMKAALSQCNTKPAAERDFTWTGGTAGGAIGGTISPDDATSTIAAMQTAGVTSILCPCESWNLGVLMRAASAQGYFPEWLVSSYGDEDLTQTDRALINAPEQMVHMFGISANPRAITAKSDPGFQAVWSVDPSYQPQGSNSIYYEFVLLAYRPMLLLASGIQMAGPHLTPQTFSDGLRRTLFPNPITSIMAGAVGFNDPVSNHSMTKDFAEFWYDPSAKDAYGNDGEGDSTGSVCYVDRGARHNLGGFPKGGDPFFVGPCDSGATI